MVSSCMKEMSDYIHLPLILLHRCPLYHAGITVHTCIDYINAKQVYNGMIQRVRDDIDGRIEHAV